MLRSSTRLGPVLAILAALSTFLFASAVFVALRVHSELGSSYTGVAALAGCGVALALVAALVRMKMIQTAAAVRPMNGPLGREKVPFWIAEDAPFERPPRR